MHFLCVSFRSELENCGNHGNMTISSPQNTLIYYQFVLSNTFRGNSNFDCVLDVCWQPVQGVFLALASACWERLSPL